jgi:hypothetical protein
MKASDKTNLEFFGMQASLFAINSNDVFVNLFLLGSSLRRVSKHTNFGKPDGRNRIGVRADEMGSQIIGRLKPDGGDSLEVRADGTEFGIIGGLKPDGRDSIGVWANGTESGIIGRLKPDGGNSIGVRANETGSQIIWRLKPDGRDSIGVRADGRGSQIIGRLALFLQCTFEELCLHFMSSICFKTSLSIFPDYPQCWNKKTDVKTNKRRVPCFCFTLTELVLRAHQ